MSTSLSSFTDSDETTYAYRVCGNDGRDFELLEPYPLYPAMCRPLVYLAQVRPDKPKHEKKRNFFMRAFQWYTEERRRQNQPTATTTTTSTGEVKNTQRDPEDAKAFAYWLDLKYQQFLQQKQSGETLTSPQNVRSGETPLSTEQNVRSGETPLSTEQNARSGETPLSTEQNVRRGETPLSTEQNVRSGETPLSTEQNVRSGETPLSTEQNVRSDETPLSTEQNVKSAETPILIQQGVPYNPSTSTKKQISRFTRTRTDSMEYILAPKNLSRMTSECCRPTPECCPTPLTSNPSMNSGAKNGIPPSLKQTPLMHRNSYVIEQNPSDRVKTSVETKTVALSDVPSENKNKIICNCAETQYNPPLSATPSRTPENKDEKEKNAMKSDASSQYETELREVNIQYEERVQPIMLQQPVNTKICPSFQRPCPSIHKPAPEARCPSLREPCPGRRRCPTFHGPCYLNTPKIEKSGLQQQPQPYIIECIQEPPLKSEAPVQPKICPSFQKPCPSLYKRASELDAPCPSLKHKCPEHRQCPTLHGPCIHDTPQVVLQLQHQNVSRPPVLQQTATVGLCNVTINSSCLDIIQDHVSVMSAGVSTKPSTISHACQTSDHAIRLDKATMGSNYPFYMKIICADRLKQ